MHAKIQASMVVLSSSSSSVSGVGVHRTYLRLPNPASTSPPFCYSADAITLPTHTNSDIRMHDDDEGHDGTPLAVTPNFLATQVWPSARAAAAAIEQHSDPSWTICEFGCGPGLPSLVAAATRADPDIGSAGRGSRVIATDYDEFALRLVEAAAREQGLQPILSTQIFDLTCTQTELPEADLYVMSDVFECSKVAVGAAKQTLRALELGKRAWIFAQSDRAQRETYRDYLNELLEENGRIAVEWTEMARLEDYADEPLVLFDVDETKVEYC